MSSPVSYIPARVSQTYGLANSQAASHKKEPSQPSAEPKDIYIISDIKNTVRDFLPENWSELRLSQKIGRAIPAALCGATAMLPIMGFMGGGLSYVSAEGKGKAQAARAMRLSLGSFTALYTGVAAAALATGSLPLAPAVALVALAPAFALASFAGLAAASSCLHTDPSKPIPLSRPRLPSS